MRNRNLTLSLFGILIFGALFFSEPSKTQSGGIVTGEAQSTSNLRGQMPPAFDQDVASVVVLMCSLPPEVNLYEATILPNHMRSFIGRG